jgi:hypothetical protein
MRGRLTERTGFALSVDPMPRCPTEQSELPANGGGPGSGEPGGAQVGTWSGRLSDAAGGSRIQAAVLTPVRRFVSWFHCIKGIENPQK